MYDACVPWPERPKGAKDKSRGPKGLELEVGARRAPKLLVCYIFVKVMVRGHQKQCSLVSDVQIHKYKFTNTLIHFFQSCRYV